MSLGNFFLQVQSQIPTQQNGLPFIGSIPQISQFSSVAFFYYYILPFLIGGLAIFGIVIGLRMWQMETSYGKAKGKPLVNRHRFFIPDLGQFDAWVTRSDRITAEENFQILKTIPEVEGKPELIQAIDSLIEKIRSGKIFAYEIKVIQRRFIRLRGNLGYALLLSTDEIENSMYHKDLARQMRSPLSPRMKENLRYIICHQDSGQFEAQDHNRRIVRVFYIAPQPYPKPDIARTEKDGTTISKQVKWGENMEEIGMKPNLIEVHSINFASQKALMELLLIAHMVADLRKAALSKEVERKAFEKMLDSSEKQGLATKYENHFLKYLLGQQELIKLGEQIISKESKSSWAWCMLFIFGTYIGLNLHNMQGLSTIDPMLGLIIADAPLAVIKWYTDEKEKSKYLQTVKEIQNKPQMETPKGV